MTRAFILAMIAVAAGGCSTLKSTVKPKEAGSATPKPVADGEIIVSALPQAALSPGECGMILWTLEENRPEAIFKLTANKGGEMVVNGAPVRFAITESGGATGFGVSEENTLKTEGLDATVKVRFALGFDGGSYLERGLITLKTPSGWTSVIPSAGVAGCRSK